MTKREPRDDSHIHYVARAMGLAHDTAPRPRSQLPMTVKDKTIVNHPEFDATASSERRVGLFFALAPT